MHTAIRYCMAASLSVLALLASEYHGQVKFGGLPVPGATVTATQNDKRFATVTDEQGSYSFADLPDGTWAVQVDMLGFATLKQDINVTSNAPATDWDLKMLGLDEIHAQVQAPPPALAATPLTTPPAANARSRPKNGQPAPTNTQTPFQRAGLNATQNAPSADAAPPSDQLGNASAADLSQRASDGLLINGSANNGASSPFGLAPAFGNNRRSLRSLYTGSLGLLFDSSVLDARQFSLTGQDTPKPDIHNLTGLLSFGGPLRIPHLIRNGPNFVINYQWTRNRTAVNQTGLMPTEAQRDGDLGQIQIPPTSISPQAKALLSLYPLPNFNGSTQYNYQIPVVGNTHQDSLQTRLNKAFRKDQFFGLFAFQSVRSDNPNIFQFLDTSRQTGINSNVNWRHAITPRFAVTLGDQFSRSSTHATPYFENRENVSAVAGVF